MMLKYMAISLIILGLMFLLIGITKKNKIFKNIGIVISIISIAFWIGFISWPLYKEESNKNITNIDNEKIAIEHYTKNLEDIPRELTVDEAVNRNYFVYDGVGGKVYNEQVLNRFVKNTEKDAKNRIADEIIIVIYNIEGDPFLYNLGYNFTENMGYVLAEDATRIDIGKTELPVNDSNYNLPEEFNRIVVNKNFPKEYYTITIEDTGFSSNAICLKSYSEKYEDVEICRYLQNNDY